MLRKMVIALFLLAFDYLNKEKINKKEWIKIIILTDLLHYISLNESKEAWAEEILRLGMDYKKRDVVWDDTDDRIPLSELYKKYSKTGRVILVEDRPAE